MNEFFQNLPSYQLSGIFIALALLAHILLGVILSGLSKQANKSKNRFDDHFIIAISLPLKSLVWFVLLFSIINIFKGEIAIFANLITYIDITPIFIITWAIIRMLSGVEAYFIDKKSVNQDSIRLVARLTKLLIIVAISLSIAQQMGFSISGLLTFGGVGGVVMGFAAKDMLANIFGGLMLQLDRPFSIGDWIRSSQFEGTVENIGWRMTRIRTFSKNPIYIPNSIFAEIPIETPSRMTNRRIKEVIGIRYDDIAQIPLIVSEVEEMLKAHKEIDGKEPLRVYFNYFNASSLDFNVYAFTKTTGKNEYQRVKQQILLKIAQIIADNKAEIAYPTQTLNIQK